MQLSRGTPLGLRSNRESTQSLFKPALKPAVTYQTAKFNRVRCGFYPTDQCPTPISDVIVKPDVAASIKKLIGENDNAMNHNHIHHKNDSNLVCRELGLTVDGNQGEPVQPHSTKQFPMKNPMIRSDVILQRSRRFDHSCERKEQRALQSNAHNTPGARHYLSSVQCRSLIFGSENQSETKIIAKRNEVNEPAAVQMSMKPRPKLLTRQKRMGNETRLALQFVPIRQNSSK